MKVIPPGNSNPEKPALLKNYIEGVNKVGDKGVIVNTFHPMDTDVAVIQGFVHANSKQTPHLKLRRMIYENQMRRGKKCVIVDSNLFLAYDKNNSKTYLRYSFDGIFANTGEYCNAPEHVDPGRWNQLKNDLGIDQIHGRPMHPQTQGKIERYHRTMKNVIKLDYYYAPEELEKALEKFVHRYNNAIMSL